jgi:hypothetical protein
MGQKVAAKCSCGYIAINIAIGGELATFNRWCAFPAYCNCCHTLVTVNLLENTVCCPTCGSHEIMPYDHKDLLRSEGENVVAWWNVSDKLGRVLMLTDGQYFCPVCRQFNLTFRPGILIHEPVQAEKTPVSCDCER